MKLSPKPDSQIMLVHKIFDLYFYLLEWNIIRIGGLPLTGKKFKIFTCGGKVWNQRKMNYNFYCFK